MMSHRSLIRIAMAGIALLGIAATQAQADHKSRYRFVPDFIEPGAGHFFFFDDEEEEIVVLPSRRQASIYEEDFGDYYEPRYVPNSKKPAINAQQAPDAKKQVKNVIVPQTQPAKKKSTFVATGITCDKGKTVVAGYGFSNVEPKACTGKVFTFRAARTGKSYDVSVSALSGEITEVRKIQ